MLIKIKERNIIKIDVIETTIHNKNVNKNRLSLIRRKIKIESQLVFSPIKLIKLNIREFLLKIVDQMVQFRRDKFLLLSFNAKNT
jgi:hypothetical protein